MAENPTIVMVPGAWHQPAIYSGVAGHLSKAGYHSVSLPLPSVGANPPHSDFDGDVTAIRDCLTKLLLEEKDIVLVVHSYSGLPGGEASKGLAKKDREARGLKGGVIRYVVINGFATPPGFQPVSPENYHMLPEWMTVDVEKGVVTVQAEEAMKIFYNDLTPEQGEEEFSRILPQSLGVYSSTATYAAWMDIPSTFIQGDKDQSSISAAMVEMMTKGAQQLNPNAFDVIEHCPEGGHCLMISYPEWTAAALIRAAGGDA